MIGQAYSRELNRHGAVNEILMQSFYLKNNVLSGIYLLVVTCLVLVATCGCRKKEILSGERNSHHVSSDEIKASSDKVVALVRSIVMKQGQILSDEEKKIILRSVPKTAQYQMAGTFGQYLWSVGVFVSTPRTKFFAKQWLSKDTRDELSHNKYV